MKPKRIILIRHGESEGNADRKKYHTIPDYALKLSEKGVGQATEAGRSLKEIITNESAFFYVSPFWRTRLTYKYIVESLSQNVLSYREEPRIREQEWGHLKDEKTCEKIDHDRNDYSSFYFRIPDGESGADVYDRVSDFFGTLHRDFEKSNFPANAVIITHGLTIRLFLMKWYHWSVEEFEELTNPHNCQIFIMELQQNGKYILNAELSKRAVKCDSNVRLNDT